MNRVHFSESSPLSSLRVTIPTTSTRTDSSGKTFTVFSINVRFSDDFSGLASTEPWNVLRRFSHFVLLHNLLQQRFGKDAVNNNKKNESAIDLPALPEKESAAVYSTSESIESRRVKLERYLSELVSIQAVWTSSEFVSFLDNESQTLLTEINYRQMVHAQRILATVGAKNVKRTQSVQQKMLETDAEMQRLNRKVDQLEAMLNARLELKTQAAQTGSINASFTSETTLSTTREPGMEDKKKPHSSSLSSSVVAAAADARLSKSVKNANLDRHPPELSSSSSSSSSSITLDLPDKTIMGDVALRYVETYKKKTAKKKDGGDDVVTTVTATLPPSLPVITDAHSPLTTWPMFLDDQCKIFRSRTVLLAGDVTNNVLSKLLDWLCGPVTESATSNSSLSPSSSSSLSGMYPYTPPHRQNSGPFEDPSEVITLADITEHHRGSFNFQKIQGRRTPTSNPTSSSSSSSSSSVMASTRKNEGESETGTGSSGVGGGGVSSSTSKTAALPGPNLFSVLSFIHQLKEQQQKDQTEAFRRQQQQHQHKQQVSIETHSPLLSASSPYSSVFQDDPALSALAEAIDDVIETISPTEESELLRGRIFSYISNILRESVCAEAVPVGSNASKLYLPGSDIDISIFIGSRGRQASTSSPSFPWNNHQHQQAGIHSSSTQPSQNHHSSSSSTPAGSEWFERINEALCLASMGASGAPGVSSSASVINSRSSLPSCKVSNVSFINADVRVVRSIVDDIEVDVTANSYTSLSAAALIEACDRIIGCNHLLKRSILLIKCWSLMEASSFTSSGESFLNSSAGGLSSMSLCIMIIALFNSHDRIIVHPLQALILFFEEYARMPWGARLITVFGPRQLYLEQGAPQPKELGRPAAPRFLTPQILRPFRLYAASCSPQEVAKGGHAQKEPSMLNVLDPSACWINMGKSVKVKGITPLNEALLLGRDRCRYLLNIASKVAASASSSSSQNETKGVSSLNDLKRHVCYLFMKTLIKYGNKKNSLNAGETSAKSNQQPHPLHVPPSSRLKESSLSKIVDPLKGDSNLLSLAMEVSGTLMGGRVSSDALSAMIFQQLFARSLSSFATPSTNANAAAHSSQAQSKSSLTKNEPKKSQQLSIGAVNNNSVLVTSSSSSAAPQGSISIVDLEKILMFLSGSSRLADIISDQFGSLSQFIVNQPHLFVLIDLNATTDTAINAPSNHKVTSKREWYVTLAPAIAEAYSTFVSANEK